MCDIVDLKCSYPGCNYRHQIHIADFCVSPSDIEMRCFKHMPKEGTWQYFYDIEDSPGSCYLRLLCDAPDGYGVSAEGGICPNAGFKESSYRVLEIN